MSDDGQSVQYVVGPGSAPAPFVKNSVAYVSAVTRTARWWKRSYSELEDENGQLLRIELYNNSEGTVSSLPAHSLYLDEYWQDRTEDYEAFVVIPTPLGTRAADAIRTACIHVALREEHLLDLLWNIGDEPDGRPNYANDYRMISWPDPSKTEEPRPKWPALASVLRTVSDSVRIEVQDLNPVTVPAA